ncbi:unnamed protein product [marine sediment metagenome]|uniref:Uncharacterized protein n=1 Tax=marine sediment metagenome TaxID=412755 RepID=X1NML5_9ZZZZ
MRKMPKAMITPPAIWRSKVEWTVIAVPTKPIEAPRATKMSEKPSTKLRL